MNVNSIAKKSSVLIVDDDALVRATIMGMLNKEFDCHYVDNGRKAIEYCKEYGSPDVILMDYHMPEFDGLKTCQAMQQFEELKHVPIVFFTGNEDCELQRKCWMAGAADFVSKPIKAEVLKMRLHHQIEVKSREAYLESLACKDSLTSLYNRQFLVQSLPRIVRQLSREQACLSVMMIDIDDFKKFNDAYGHLDGDKVLKAVAKTLSGIVKRPTDFVLRFGGEEFVVLLPKTKQKEAHQLAHDMTRAVERLLIRHKHSDFGRVTVSIGVSSSENKASLKFVELLKAADEALYAAKALGKNTVAVYTSPRRSGNGMHENYSATRCVGIG